LTDPAPQREAILTALERLLAWPEISRSPQLGRFLGYIVQRTLEGSEQSIKAYSIAVDVFGRTADFDPQADPIVRVQARRLRGLLDEYYRGPGMGEAMQIHLPVGRYVPEFAAVPESGEVEAGVEVEPDTQARKPAWPGAWSFSASWFALAMIALGLAMAAYAMTAWRPNGLSQTGALQRPTITIVEFQNLATAMTPQVAGLAIELVTDLEQFGSIGVRYGGGGEANVAVAGLPTSDFVLTGIVRPDGPVVQYSAILTDSVSGAVVWNHTIAVPTSEAAGPDVLDKVSKSLSLVLGSPRGPLHVAARQLLASSAPLDGQINLYLCRVLFDLYRETGSASEAARADVCYRALPETDRDSAAVLAATASLLAEQGSVEGGSDVPAGRFRMASANLERAIGLDPISGFVWEQQARLHEAEGQPALARADFSSSVQLNPASVDALAAYARLLAFGGNLAEAEAMALDAARGSPNPPAWYEGVPALLALRDGDFARAIDYAELYAQADRELGPILAIMAAQRSGESDVVNRYLPQVLDVAAFRAKGVLPRLRERIGDDGLMDSIRNALVQAGVPPTALIRSF
jgi:tetratricopeptide (TPR) repeat protein/TolB-like protein